MNDEKTSLYKKLLLPGIPFILFWSIACSFWLTTGEIGLLINFGYLGSVLGIGLAAYSFLPRKRKTLARKATQFAIGLYLLILPSCWFINMQIEGFFFLIVAGVAGGAIQHYLIAKIIGPLFFGRLYCGWGCWTAMILDLLPYSKNTRGWSDGWWKHLRLVHFLLSLSVVLGFYYVVQYRGFVMDEKTISASPSEIVWIAVGNLLYYSIGKALAFVLKDNRAFCKYACPITVFMKIGTRFSLMKIAGNTNQCSQCNACSRVCPMSIDIPRYIANNERVLSTECTLCQTCTTVCPKDLLHVSTRFDIGGKEYLLSASKDQNETAISNPVDAICNPIHDKIDVI